MKRLMILVAMMAFVLLLPMNAEAANDLIVDLDYGTYTLTENMTVDNLEVYSKLDLNGYKLEVKGDVIAEAELRVGSGTLTVAGDYIQKAGYLIVNGGSLTVNGDFRVQDINENGEYVSSRGGFGSFYDGGTITVEGDTYIDVVHMDGCGLTTGTFVAKGDFIVENAYAFGSANKMAALEMAGKTKQKLSLINDMYIDNLVFTNQNVEISGRINVKLGSDATKITLDDGICEVSYLDLNGYDMVIPGTVHAYGDVKVGDGALTVTKDYVQPHKTLSIGTGTITVKENLRFQGIDENGKYTCGSGNIVDNKGSMIVVGKDLIIDSEVTVNPYSTIQVAGNISKTAEGKFRPRHIVLNGAANQSITLKGTEDHIETLELMKERKYCTFTPENCWNKIVQLEGIRNTPEGFKYYEDGNWADKAYKFVDYDGGKFLVANGFVATHINGIAQDPIYTDNWYFLSQGQVQMQHTGLAEYDGQWFYVEEGKLDTAMNGCIEYGGKLFMLAAGRIISETSGLVQDPGTGYWYYLANGQAQTQYTGLATYNKEWFYVVKGILAEDYTGKVKYDGQYFNVVNGMVK